MQYQVKTSGGLSMVPLETRLLANRIVFIEGEINQASACEFVRQILLLNREDAKAPIHLVINSPGGEVNAGMLMYDALCGSAAPIVTYCAGMAYSMGAVLFACGQHGRYMLPHSELMLHEPLLGNRVGGNASSIRSISDSLLETRSRMNQLLAKHTGKTEAEIEEATSYDHFFDAEESCAFGLADGIRELSALMEV